MEILVGLAVGILGVLALALKLADKKAETEAPNSIAAVGLDMNGNGTSIETSIDRDTLKRVFKHLENGIS